MQIHVMYISACIHTYKAICMCISIIYKYMYTSVSKLIHSTASWICAQSSKELAGSRSAFASEGHAVCRNKLFSFLHCQIWEVVASPQNDRTNHIPLASPSCAATIEVGLAPGEQTYSFGTAACSLQTCNIKS